MSPPEERPPMSEERIPLDVLAIAAHPDDAEISAGGTIARLVEGGYRVGVLDLTRGEMGTRGTQEDREEEAQRASELLGLRLRLNLGLPDGRLEATVEARERVAALLRAHTPRVVLAHHSVDPHPDHCAAARIAQEAWYLSGLRRLAELAGGPPARRPARLYRFLSHTAFEPSLVVDVSAVFSRKLRAIQAYATQLSPQDASDTGRHFLFGADLEQRVITKNRYHGESIGAEYGEPFLSEGPVSADCPLLAMLAAAPPTGAGTE